MEHWVLAGDVGGTKTSLAICRAAQPKRPGRGATYSSAEFPSFEAVLADFLARGDERPDAGCIGVAGPVLGNRCQTTNLPWVLEGQALASRFGIPTVEIVNDLVALGHGLPVLQAGELETLHDGTADAQGNALLVAVGTGLGVALLVREGPGFRPLPSEAGHMDLAARDETEARIVARLAERFGGHVSIERVVSGCGLRNLYETLRALRVAPERPEVRAAIESSDAGAAIHAAAVAGDPLSRATLDRFLSWFGATLGNLALAGLATGGISVGGGMAPKILDELRRPAFLAALRGKGRFRELLERVPLRVILATEAGLWGAAALAAESARRSSR